MLKTDLIKGNILPSLVIFAIPLIISNVFQQLYNTADIMIVGHYLGDTSLAAIGASTVIFELLVGFTLGFGNGLSIVVARNFGSGNKEAIKKLLLNTHNMNIISRVGTSHNIPLEEPELLSFYIKDWIKTKN